MNCCVFYIIYDKISYLSVDINECAVGKHNCHAKAACVNTEGSFLCTCRLGYIGDGIFCSGTLCKHSIPAPFLFLMSPRDILLMCPPLYRRFSICTLYFLFKYIYMYDVPVTSLHRSLRPLLCVIQFGRFLS